MTVTPGPLVSGSAAGALPLTQVRPRYRWTILAVAWACYLVSSVDRFAWGALSLLAQDDLKLTLPQVGTFVTAYFTGYLLSNCVSGALADRIGPRLALSGAVLGAGLCTAAFGLTRSYGVGLALQFGMGFATGADYAACIKMVTAWFEREERGLALGLWFTSTSLGVVLANSAAVALAATAGWRGAYAALGLLTALIAVVGFILLADRTVWDDKKKETTSITTLLRNRDLLLISFAGFGALWGTWGFAFSANALMVKGAGLTAATAASVVATFGVGGFIAKPLIGIISDWLGARRKWPAIVTLIGFVAILLIFPIIRSEWAFFVAGPLLGVTAFIYSPLMAAMVAETAPRDSTGAASGLSNALWQLGGVIVPVTVAFAFSRTQSFAASFIVLAAGPLLGILCLLPVREHRATPQ